VELKARFDMVEIHSLSLSVQILDRFDAHTKRGRALHPVRSLPSVIRTKYKLGTAQDFEKQSEFTS